MSEHSFMKVADVAKELDISQSYAYKIIRRLNAELKELGLVTVAGRVNRKYFYERLYYLLTILANNERSLTKACSILISRKNILKLSEDDVLLLRQMLKNHISSGHDLEVIWLTYLLLETTALSSDDISLIIESGNELAHTLLLRKKCLSSSQLDIVRSRANSWFLLYELFAADVIDEVAFAKKLNIDHNLTMYQKIKERNEHFCK